jgi:hypothetical protein
MQITAKKAGFFALILVCLLPAAAWLTHVVVAIQVLTSDVALSIGYGALLGIGAIFPPIGAIHGAGIWFGIW